VDFFNWLNVKLVLFLNVFNILLYLGKIGGQGRPSLGSIDGPEVDASRLDADSSDEGALGMPL